MANRDLKCPACSESVVDSEKKVVQVQPGTVDDVEDDIVDFTEQGEAMCYMHLQCFLLSTGDPRGVKMMMQEGS